MKKTDRSLKSSLSFAAAALLAVGAATAQVAIADTSFPGTASIDNTGNYRSEVNSCLTGHTQQSRADCLKEARNAAADKSRGRLETYGMNEQHATARCDVHTNASDRAACEARMLGAGSVEGSVAGGGLIREVETPVTP